jgi:hypothetical protein
VQDQEPAIWNKVEKKGPRRVNEGEGKGKERKGRGGERRYHDTKE